MKFVPGSQAGAAELRDKTGALITAYQFDNFEFHPHCHPVNLPGEIPLTLVNPGDHPWHSGMYFAWKYLNGCNVWDFECSGPKPGKVIHRGIEFSDDEPKLVHDIDWMDSEDRLLLRERRTLKVAAVDFPDFAHRYDWHFHFECMAPEVICEREEKYGGYAGFGVRFARGGFNLLANAAGEENWPENWQNQEHHESKWTAYGMSLDSLPSRTWDKWWGGIAVFDHPENPRYPTPWLTFNQLTIQKIMPAFLRKAPYVFRQGQSLDLRYRAVSFAGRPNPTALDALWEEWAVSGT